MVPYFDLSYTASKAEMLLPNSVGYQVSSTYDRLRLFYRANK